MMPPNCRYDCHGGKQAACPPWHAWPCCKCATFARYGLDDLWYCLACWIARQKTPGIL